MASQALIGSRTSIPVLAATPSTSHHPQGESICRETSLFSIPTRSRFLGGHQHKLEHYSQRFRSPTSEGGCWAVAGHVGLLSSAGIVDQNERLKDAAKSGDLGAVNEILRLTEEVSVDLPSSGRAGWTALHLACFYGHLSIVQRLLEAGANVEVRNNSGNTPLQLASLKGNIDIARILMESGADLYAESLDRGTALDYAQEWGGEDIVDFLLLWAAKKNYNL